MDKLSKKIKEGYTAWGKIGQFSDYVKKTNSKHFGKDQLHPITVTTIIGNGKYCIITKGTSSSEKITNTLKIGTEKITYNNYDTYLFEIETISSQMYRFIGYADINSEEYKKLKHEGKNRGQHRKIIQKMLTEIKKNNSFVVDEIIQKQFYPPTEEQIRYKTVYTKAMKYTSKIEREEYLIKNGIDLKKYDHKKSKTSLNKPILDDEPED